MFDSVRQAKAQATILHDRLAPLGLALARGQCLEIIAALHGARDWNTFAARANAPAPAAANRQASGSVLALPAGAPGGVTDTLVGKEFCIAVNESWTDEVLTETGRRLEYRPSVVVRDEPFHRPLDYTWGSDYGIAKAAADTQNERLGLTAVQVDDIIASSMRAANKQKAQERIVEATIDTLRLRVESLTTAMTAGEEPWERLETLELLTASLLWLLDREQAAGPAAGWSEDKPVADAFARALRAVESAKDVLKAAVD